ncbi:MAG: MFS transporter [Thermodesulfobacteriota bacterium]
MLPWRRNLYIMFAVQLVSMSGFSMVFPFLPLYVKQLGVSTSGSVEFWSGMVFSAQPLTMMISAPVWGAMADRFGRKMMLARATFGGAVLLSAMGFAQNAEQLALLRALQGLVTGTMPAANALVAASAPREHSGEALGLLQTGAWVGVAVGPLLGGVIGDAVGFRESFWITGVLLALSGASVLLWVEEDFRPADRTKRPRLMAGYRWLLQTPVLVHLYVITFMHALGRMLIMPIAALFMMQLMGTREGVATLTGIMMGAMAVTSSVSGVLMGRLGDRIGHGRVLLASVLAAVVFYLPQGFVTAPWQLVLLQALTGLANGGMIPTIAALMNLQDTSGSQGAIYGLNASITAAGRSLAPMLGASMAIWFGMRSVFLASAGIYAAAAVMVFYIFRTGRRNG